MKSQRELIAAANENFIASFRKLADHTPEGAVREFGGTFAFVTGLPFSLFNGCVVIAPTAPAELEAALQWVSRRSTAHQVWIDETLASELSEIPPSHGFARARAPYPGMVLHPPPASPAHAPGVTVVSVSDAGLDEFVGVGVEGGLAPDVAHRLFSPAFERDAEVELFVGRLDGRPVGTSIAIRSRAASGIYNVVTLPNGRRRGVGAALTWAAVEAGRAWGFDVIVLQSSSMALPMYSRMGFRTVAPYTTFTKLSP
jgi:GNAT superfamily N-acetyltransferase